MDLQFRLGVGNQTILKALKSMEAHLEVPLSRRRLAKLSGISLRQLERLFHREIGYGIHAHYLALHIGRSRQRPIRIHAVRDPLARPREPGPQAADLIPAPATSLNSTRADIAIDDARTKGHRPECRAFSLQAPRPSRVLSCDRRAPDRPLVHERLVAFRCAFVARSADQLQAHDSFLACSARDTAVIPYRSIISS